MSDPLPPLYEATDDERRSMALALRFLARHFRMENTADNEHNEANFTNFLNSLADEFHPNPEYSPEEIERYGVGDRWVECPV